MRKSAWLWLLAFECLFCFPNFAAADDCSRTEFSMLSEAFGSIASKAARPVVWFQSNNEVQMESCQAEDRYISGKGVLSFTGTDDADYWIEAQISISYSGRVQSFNIENANGNFIKLAIIKGIPVLIAAGAAGEYCHNHPGECG